MTSWDPSIQTPGREVSDEEKCANFVEAKLANYKYRLCPNCNSMAFGLAREFAQAYSVECAYCGLELHGWD